MDYTEVARAAAPVGPRGSDLVEFRRRTASPPGSFPRTLAGGSRWRSPNSAAGLGRRTFVTGVVGVLGAIIGAVVGLPAIGYWLAPVAEEGRDRGLGAARADRQDPGRTSRRCSPSPAPGRWAGSAAPRATGCTSCATRTAGCEALSNVCTHLSCRVTWKAEQDQYPVSVPRRALRPRWRRSSPARSPAPMDRFEFKIEDGTLLVHVVEA